MPKLVFIEDRFRSDLFVGLNKNILLLVTLL